MNRPTTSLLHLALAFSIAETAWAETKPATHTETTATFNIPSQNLANALANFTQQSHVQVLYEGSIAQGQHSVAVKGSHNPEHALQLLLQNTNLQARFTDRQTVTLEQKIAAATPSNIPSTAESASIETVPAVVVTGQQNYSDNDPYNPDYNRANASTATKTDTPIIETPLNIKIVPQQVLKDQQIYQLDKVLQNVSGTFADTNGSNGGNNMVTTIRGFSSSDIYRNGLRFPSAQSIGTADLANIDRVEILKGPASMLYGQIEPGGIVNLVPKTPLATPYYSVQQLFGSYRFFRTTADATGPIGAQDNLLYRLNFAYEDAGSFQENRTNQRYFVAPVVRWNIGPRTQATFEFEFKDSRDPVDYGIPASGNRPYPASRRFNPNEPSNSNDSRSYLAGFNWSHGFNDNWTLRQNFYWVGTDTHINTAIAYYFDPSFNLYRVAGPSGLSSDTYFTTLNLTGKFDTFGLANTLLMGWDYYTIDQKNPVQVSNFSSINVSNPVHGGIFGDIVQHADYANQQEWYGFYLQDQIKLPYQLQLLAGFRYDNATSHFKATERLPTSSPYYYGDYKMQSDDDKTTPRVGLLWHPIPEFSLYGNYVENFGAPNMTTVSSVGGATPLGPQTAQQWEVGMKGELFNGRLTGSLAWFNLTKQNIPAADPNNPLKTVLMGEARNQGLEIDLAGEVLPGWRIIAAGAYIDSVITKDSQPEYAANGALIGTNNGNMGKHLYNVPKFSGSVWNTYEWQDGPWRGLKIGGGIVGRSQAEGDSANTFQLPSYVLTNLMLAYPIQYGRSKVHLQLNVDNLLDKSYFYSSTGTAWNGAHYGAPRTFLGSIRLEF